MTWAGRSGAVQEWSVEISPISGNRVGSVFCDADLGGICARTEMTEAEHDNHCPLNAVDRRLGDLHRHWHEAER